MKVTIKMSTKEITKIQAARAAKAQTEAELDAFTKRALENAVPWNIGLNDEDIAAYRAAREEGRRLAEKYGDCTPETLISKIENMEAEMESLIKNRDEIQNEKQALKAEISKLCKQKEGLQQEMDGLYSRSICTEGCLRDLCGSILDDYNGTTDPAAITRAALKAIAEHERERRFIRMIAMSIYPEAVEKTPVEIMFEIAEANNFEQGKNGGPNNVQWLNALYDAWCSGDESGLQNPEIQPEYPLPQVN